jgi:large subunit ribosomal protein L6
MSRIGKLPISIPTGVEVKTGAADVQIKGPKGTLSRALPPSVSVGTEEGNIVVSRKGDEKSDKAMHGLARALIQNMVRGVTDGFKKELEVIGVGYRVNVQGKTLTLELGYSHPILYPFPEGIDIKVEKNLITVLGADKEKVGQVAAEIRGFRKPEPYKGKGVRYVGERVRTKVGKRNA